MEGRGVSSLRLFVAASRVVFAKGKSTGWGLWSLVLRFTNHVGQFAGLCVAESLALAFQGFPDLDNRLLHLLVRFLGATNQEHVVSLGDPLVPVAAVQPNA